MVPGLVAALLMARTAAGARNWHSPGLRRRPLVSGAAVDDRLAFGRAPLWSCRAQPARNGRPDLDLGQRRLQAGFGVLVVYARFMLMPSKAGRGTSRHPRRLRPPAPCRDHSPSSPPPG